jgi:hypothetical protein
MIISKFNMIQVIKLKKYVLIKSKLLDQIFITRQLKKISKKYFHHAINKLH